MAAATRTTRAAKLKLRALLTGMILIPALLPLLFDGMDDLHRQGWRLALQYLFIIAWPTLACGELLYDFALLPASPIRHTLDRLLAAFCVFNCGELFLTTLHPHDAAKNNGLLTFAILFVALSLCGLYWPLDASSRVVRRTPIPRWIGQIAALLLAVSPLPLAIWLSHIDPARFAKGTTEYNLPVFVYFALLAATWQGLRWTARISARPSTVAPVEAAAASAFEKSTESPEPATSSAAGDVALAQPIAESTATGMPTATVGHRGVLLSRSTCTRREGACGELWLFPEGLLRIPLGWLRTLTLAGQFYDGRRPTIRTFDPAAFARATTDLNNLWIPGESVETATLRHILGYDELRVSLTDERSLRLLWSPMSSPYSHMRTVLGEWLGERLVAL